MNKPTILKALLTELEEDLRRQLAANEQASAGATHSEARAETKWDTCGLEASYLARGHAQQFQALAADIETLRKFSPPDYTDRPIGPGALVKVDADGETLLFFLLNCGGGTDLIIDGEEITVITPESPVGAALVRKQQGDAFSFRSGSTWHILHVR